MWISAEFLLHGVNYMDGDKCSNDNQQLVLPIFGCYEFIAHMADEYKVSVSPILGTEFPFLSEVSAWSKQADIRNLYVPSTNWTGYWQKPQPFSLC